MLVIQQLKFNEQQYIRQQFRAMSVTSYRFLFHLHLGTLNLSTSLECQIAAVWKRSGESARSQTIPFSKGSANFDETLTLPVNMYFDSNTNSFQEKKSQLNFTLHTQKGDKSAGVVVIDLSLMLNNKLEVIQDKLALEKCPDKNAKVEIKLTCESKGEINPSQSSVAGPLDVTNISTVSLPGVTVETLASQPPLQAIEGSNKPEKGQNERGASLQKQNQSLRRQIQALKRKQTSQMVQHKKQIQKLNKQLSSLKLQLTKSRANQQSMKTKCLSLQQKSSEYQGAKKRLEIIYDEIQQYI